MRENKIANVNKIGFCTIRYSDNISSKSESTITCLRIFHYIRSFATNNPREERGVKQRGRNGCSCARMATPSTSTYITPPVILYRNLAIDSITVLPKFRSNTNKTEIIAHINCSHYDIQPILIDFIQHLLYFLRYNETVYRLSNAMHGQNINLPVCGLSVCLSVCLRHTFCQLAYRSDPLTPPLNLNPRP